MNDDSWSRGVAAGVAERIRAARDAAGFTVVQLAERCAALGLPGLKSTITNLETGRRASVDLSEFLVLAEALAVPPISLLFPIGTSDTVEVTPGRAISTWDAVAWFTGEAPAMEAAPEGSPREILDAFRAHYDALSAAVVSSGMARDRRRKASTTLDSERRTELLERARGYEELAFEDARELAALRSRLRTRGLTPPDLPEHLRFVDAPGGDGESAGE